jgi:L-seryl-tRNA(Ser) seleniumtransferase
MSLRELPSIDLLLQLPDTRRLTENYGRDLTLDALRATLALARDAVRAGEAVPSHDALLESAQHALAEWTAPSLVPVINATGVILHTNLGRAPLSAAALRAMQQVAQGYSTLEFDLETGQRGARTMHAERLLTRITGAEAALVVNNNAGAVLLALSALAKGREVIISRSQLVEVGGGFRIPDVMRQSGARLVEVGTSNRTHPADFEDAVGPRSALLLRAHHSNFRLIGFTSEPTLVEMATIASAHEIPLIDDLGSGALLDTAAFSLGHEPMVQESLGAGAALVMFSGDKLLGGPQAGILVGREEILAKLRKHPLARALRADKLCLAALEATLLHYARGEATRVLPVWQMIAAPLTDLRARAERWSSALGLGTLIETRSTVGGGSLPEETLPTWALALDLPKPQTVLARLRQSQPPIIARVEEQRVLLDPRTVLPEQDETLLRLLREALAALPAASIRGKAS